MHTNLILLFIALAFAGVVAIAIANHFRHVFVIQEWQCGLLYHHGLYVRRINAGRHTIWGRGWTIALHDLRKSALAVPGQDVLTADNVGLKLSVFVTYQVSDPAKATHDTQNWYSDLYNAAQLATRTVIGAAPVETLLNQRATLAPQLLALVQPEAAKFGVAVHAVELKDVMFPGELKRVFADVLKAKQEGQAALERARGESAALRNLANAARVLEGNPALMNLRVLQSLASAQQSGNTLVLGVPGFVPLKNGKTHAPAPH
jgi:regulator of protease activity HflC (stomatin/prohibitin superfamily)